MSFAKTSADIEGEPFGPAFVKRGLPIKWLIWTQSATTGAWSKKDISGARWTYNLRQWTSDDDAAPIAADEVVTKGTASATGELDHYHSNGATAYATLAWEIVEVDNDNADATTRTGQREVVKVRWFQPILDAP